MESLGKAAKVSKAELALNLREQAADHKVATDNARFAKASPARKRVIIAKDVLLWLSVGKLTPHPGTYLSPYMYNPDVGEYIEKDGEVVNGRVRSDRVNGGSCSACALGAVFACAVERTGGDYAFWGASSDYMVDKLAPFFDGEQLRQIEVAFECFPDSPVDPDQRYYRFGMAIGPGDAFARKRMSAIMQNIIDNNGTFVVEE